MSTRENLLVDRRTLGKRLRSHRVWREWTLREVEARTEIPHATIGRWENAKGNDYPPIDGLAALADAYETTVFELLSPSDPGSPSRVRLKAAA